MSSASSMSSASTPEKRSRESDMETQNHNRPRIERSDELLGSHPKLTNLAFTCHTFKASIRDSPIRLSKKLSHVFFAIHSILPGGRFDDLSGEIFHCGWWLIFFIATPLQPIALQTFLLDHINRLLTTFQTNDVALEILRNYYDEIDIKQNIKCIQEGIRLLEDFHKLVPPCEFGVSFTYGGIQGDTGSTIKSFIDTDEDGLWFRVEEAVKRMGDYAQDPIGYTGLDRVLDCWIPALTSEFVGSLTNFLKPNFYAFEPEHMESMVSADNAFFHDYFYYQDFGVRRGLHMSSCVQCSLILGRECVQASAIMRRASKQKPTELLKVFRTTLHCIEDLLQTYPDDNIARMLIAKGLRKHCKYLREE